MKHTKTFKFKTCTQIRKCYTIVSGNAIEFQHPGISFKSRPKLNLDCERKLHHSKNVLLVYITLQVSQINYTYYNWTKNNYVRSLLLFFFLLFYFVFLLLFYLLFIIFIHLFECQTPQRKLKICVQQTIYPYLSTQYYYSNLYIFAGKIFSLELHKKEYFFEILCRRVMSDFYLYFISLKVNAITAF